MESQERGSVPTTPEREVPLWASADDLEQLAQGLLDPATYDSIAGAAGDELSFRANLRGFERFYLRPRVLVDVSSISTETTVLGTHLAAPLFVAPMGGKQSIHPKGEAAMADGAARAGVGFILSTESSTPLEEVARSAGDARWFQLYFISPDRGLIADLVHRASANGFRALCVTVDAPVAGLRRRDFRHGKTLGPEGGSPLIPSYGVVNDAAVLRFPLHVSDPALTWKDIEWVKSISEVPVLVKGLMTAEDARAAVASGVDGLVVSNHGGRHLDHTIGTIEALPEVAEAVGKRIAVIVDGGVRRSTDIAIALALGADAVAIGRPAFWALVYGGSTGVTSFLRDLVTGLARTMAELGITSVAQFSAACVGRRASL